jgi:hypothetical protein
MQVDERIWLVTVMHYDPGDFDNESSRSSTHSVQLCYLCLRNGPLPMCP